MRGTIHCIEPESCTTEKSMTNARCKKQIDSYRNVIPDSTGESKGLKYSSSGPRSSESVARFPERRIDRDPPGGFALRKPPS